MTLNRRRAVSVFAVFFALILAPTLSAAEEATPIKCLQIGLEPHGTANVWAEALAAIEADYPSVQITAVTSENLEALRYENLKQYDVLHVVQLKVENGDPPDFVKEGILQFLKEGGGLVVNHFAVANCQNWRDSIDIFGAMWVSGKSTHDPYHTFRMDIVDEAHPILEGVTPFTTDDELYFNLLMRPDMHVIMTADQERFGHTVPEPLLCTHYVHNARCVYFALGHDPKSCSNPMFPKIVVRSIEWAAKRR
ncbi:MAG: ThuA domain-containing protein [Candidatus Omnitrophica bacterium]|nr:ThuA domain-containing protein [Candidatus Omnitrophota bacterium]